MVKLKNSANENNVVSVFFRNSRKNKASKTEKVIELQ